MATFVLDHILEIRNALSGLVESECPQAEARRFPLHKSNEVYDILNKNAFDFAHIFSADGLRVVTAFFFIGNVSVQPPT